MRWWNFLHKHVSTGGKKVNTFSGVIATMLVYHLRGKTGSSAVSANGKQQYLITIYSKSPNLTIEARTSSSWSWREGQGYNYSSCHSSLSGFEHRGDLIFFFLRRARLSQQVQRTRSNEKCNVPNAIQFTATMNSFILITNVPHFIFRSLGEASCWSYLLIFRFVIQL